MTKCEESAKTESYFRKSQKVKVTGYNILWEDMIPNNSLRKVNEGKKEEKEMAGDGVEGKSW